MKSKKSPIRSAFLNERTDFNPVRRNVLKGGTMLGLTSLSPLALLSACGDSDNGKVSLKGSTKSVRESRHLNFDLSHGDIANPRFQALNSADHNRPLIEHTDASRARHREQNPMLSSVPDDQLTHYLEDVDLPADALQVVGVAGQHPQTGELMVAGHFMHVPQSSLDAVAKRRAARGQGTVAMTRKFSAYGAGERALKAAPVESQIAFNSMPWDVAVWLVFQNPAITNLNPDLGAEILDRIQNLPCDPNDQSCSPYLGTLAFKIATLIGENNFPTMTSASSWAMLVQVTDPATGLPAVDSQGVPVCRYQINPALADAARQASMSVLNDINNDPLFAGTNWQPRDGGTTPSTALAKVGFKDLSDGAFTVVSGAANGTRLSGVRLYDATAGDDREVTVTVRNEFIRTAGAFVEYLDANMNSLPVANPVEGEDTSRAKLVQFVAPAISILGIPLQGTAQPATALTFTMPTAAAHARLYFGGLGTGGDAFTPEAVAASIMTLTLNIGLPALCLAMGIYPDGEKLLQNTFKDLLEDKLVAKDILTELAGSSLLKEGIYSWAETGSPKGFLVELADTLMELFLKHSPRLAQCLAEIITQDTAEKAIPIVGQALWALSEAADVATLGETLIEVLTCRAVQTNVISLTMTSTVRISRDPEDFQFPASARTFVVNAYYDGGKTPRIETGTITQGQVDPIDIVFANVPSGGNVRFEAFFLSAAGCLVGSASMAESIKNMPDTASLVQLQIKEIAAPLDASTTFQHSLKLGWQGGHREWVTAAAPTAVASGLCQGGDNNICSLNGLTVHTPSGMAGYGFNAGGQGVSLCSGGNAASMYTLQNVFLGREPESALKFSGCGYTDPVGIVYSSHGPTVGGNNFFLQPGIDGLFHVRSVDLTPSVPLNMFQQTSWGRFSTPMTSLTVTSNGYLVGVNRTTHKMEVLLLPQAASTDDTADASQAAPFSNAQGGYGSAVGLMDTPVAVASYSQAVLVLEQGNARVQAFTHSGDESIKMFNDANGAPTALMPLVQESDPSSVVYVDLAVDGTGYIFVLSYISSGAVSAASYRLDVYTPTGSHLCRTTGVAAGGIAVDLFRNLYTLNYEVLAGSPRVEPSLSQWLPISTTPCPSTLPSTTAAAQGSLSCAAPVLASV